MTRRRIILLILLVLAVWVSVEFFRHPGPGHELAVLIFVIPVVVLNAWEYFSPEIMEAYFGKKTPETGAAAAGKSSQAGTAGGPALQTGMPEVPLTERMSGQPEVLGADPGTFAAAAERKPGPIPASAVQNRALSIRQPHAEKILQGVKTIEYRRVPTNIRGRVYIYASKQPAERHYFEELGAQPGDFPSGVLVGTVEIVGCERPSPSELYQWQLASPERLAEPLEPEQPARPVWFVPFRLEPSGE
jgi:hypothetical protein